MSRYISSYLSEPLLRRARQLHGSLSDQSDTGPETQRTRPGNGESRGEVGVTGMANSNRSIDVRHMPSGDEVSFAIPEEVSHSSTPHYEDDNTYRHSDIDARDPSLPLHHFSARTHVAVLEETDGTVERPSLDSIDGMSQPQTPLSGPVPVDSSSRTIGSNVRIGGIVQVREPDGRSSGHSELYYAADFHLEVKSGSALPEDDGMRTLREKIHNIRDAKISNAEKARLIHALMTENYNSSLHKRYSKSRSPTSCHDQERPCIPVSHSKRSSGPFSMSPTSPTSASSLGFPYHLTDDDLRPSYAPRHDSSSDLSGESIISFPKESANDDAVEEENLQLGCQHYKRKVKLQCYTCKAWYPCRFCHDQEEDHVLIRRATQNMLCMRPGNGANRAASKPPATTARCANSGITTARKAFTTVTIAGFVVSVKGSQTHRCIERSTQCDCPICGDYMFTSPETVIFMKCGHSIHQKCFSQYSTTSYRCPICSKTIANMEAHFRSLDRTINDQPMPPDFMDTRALISCNDCSAKSAVQYHWLGLKCEICYSYNTTQIQLLTANDNNDENTHEANEIRNISRNITVPTRMTRLPPNSDENHTPTETTFLSTMSRSVPAHDSNIILGTLQSTDQTTSYRRSFSTIPLRTVPAVIGNYFGLRRQSDSFWSSSAPASDEDKNRSNNNDNEDIDFWGSKASRPTFGIFGDGKDDDETVLFEDESENTDGSDYSSNDEHQEDTEEEDEDDIDEIDIFGHR
ncbi:CHY zinc finger domain-containing protein [Histoplasma capsulatum var. duboisii H88]|uniref:CHY zinc finger domain-containing protein n=1 Tax=Ajellomyces capsulatus (strain H88) TaxID=544711 RepID=F0US88_AJEC8|nr:CHY zinc finger domain-containing protein [Histoplasma capsulatum var. duboisii H88]